ncbi:MAG: flippase activity-associated protein Agl23 [Planctomycetota bacterium]|jgi:uncharacterized protein (TIGR03663 family)
MKQKTLWILLFAVVLAAGAFFRLWRLNDRPMHTDEAVHAEKFGALLEEGSYFYDANEFHGPTLNYLTLLSAWVRGQATYSDISEATMRLVPAVFGIALILTPLFFFKQIGIRAAFFSAVLIAFSPAFVYYSRYYIMEILLVFFTGCFLGALWKYRQRPKVLWLILAGISMGLMHATKETFVFSIAAALVGFIVSVVTQKQRLVMKVSHVLAGLIAFCLTSVIFFSSFGSNPGGIVDSVMTYAIWAKRAGGESVHIHPWFYYLNLLTWLEFIEPITWNEDGIVAFALIGLFMVFFKKGGRRYAWGRYIAVFTLVLTVMYCVIPYKTPWSMLSFFYGMALLGGFTVDRLLCQRQGRWAKAVLWIVLLIYGLISPAVQSWLLNFNYSSDITNPYVYAHTDADVYTMVSAVQEAVKASDAGYATPVMVIAADGDCWPFPWYLRNLTQAGYLMQAEPYICSAPIIIANAAHEQKILNTLYTVPPAGQRHMYLPLFNETLQLRPGVEWRGYIRKDLWDKMQEQPDLNHIMQPREETVLEAKPDKKQIDNLVKFSHRAMKADFAVFIQHEDGTYAGRAARAAFNEVDRLEAIMSRFIENSDVSRINELAVGDDAIVDEDVMACLQVARRAYEMTEGAYDPTIGMLIDAWKHQQGDKASQLLANRPNMTMLALEDGIAVVKKGEHVSVDLGGVAKGYAVDKIAEVLAEWDIERALIHGGASSVKAMVAPNDKPGWIVTITNSLDRTRMTRLEMENEVLSCSGLHRGLHIINPFTGQAVTDRHACWIRTKQSAALADALTTAGMIMPIEKLQKMRQSHDGMSVMVLMTEPTEVIRYGHWPEP